MRNLSVDKYMEQKFGRPDFKKSFVKDNQVWTPIGKWNLWRIDPLFKVIDKEIRCKRFIAR